MSTDGILLEYKGKKNDVIKYKTIVDSNQILQEKDKKQEISSKIEILMSQTIMEVDGDGNLTVDVVIEDGKVTRGGESSPLPNAGQKITMKMKKTGEVTYTSVPIDFSQPSFPEGLKKKKDRWDSISTINVQERQEPIKLNYKYILWDIIKQGKYDCAEIKVSCPETSVELQEGVMQTISATGSTYFAHTEGFLLKSEVETQTVITVPKEEVVINTRIRVNVDLAEIKKA